MLAHLFNDVLSGNGLGLAWLDEAVELLNFEVQPRRECQQTQQPSVVGAPRSMACDLPVLPTFHNVAVAYDPWQLRLARWRLGHGQHDHAYIVLRRFKGGSCL